MSVPRHVGIILDGNRRFARRLMAKPWKGHEWGAKKVQRLLEWSRDLGIEELTLFAFSMQNFKRPQREFDYLMKVFIESSDELLARSDELNDQGLRVCFLGRLHLFPKQVRERMEQVMERTRNNAPRRLNLAMAYGGREEVVDAARKVAEQVQQGRLDLDAINEELFSTNLYHDSEPDLVIRTGGDHRTSNFLIWQANYAEWFFVEKCWPEFEREDLQACLTEYAQRERRFGR